MKSAVLAIAAIASFITALCCSSTVYAAATVSIPSTGSGSLVVRGADLDKVAAMDVVVGYNAATMASPRVTQGSLITGATMVANTDQPGTVHIAIVFPYPKVVSGSGEIATISFALLGAAPGTVTSFSVSFLDVKGQALAVQSYLVEAGTIAQSASSSDSNVSTVSGGGMASSSTGASSGGSPTVLGGSVAMPSDVSPAEEKPKGEAVASKPEEAPKVATPAAESGSAEGKPSQVASMSPKEKNFTGYKSVLERFREFQGEKSPKSLMALFAAENMRGIRQEPAIALTDGKSKLTLFFDLPASGDEAPRFSLAGAMLVSLRLEGSEWVVEALPDQGAYAASMTVVQGASTTVIPLTVAPRTALNPAKDGKIGEAEFTMFLKDRGSEKSPKFDLNGDGMRNYIDDYIYTANYLVLQEAKEKAPSGKP